MIVTAHPDDEAMFFGPVIGTLDPENSFLLCLSNGNADGLGHTREQELIRSCAILGLDVADGGVNSSSSHVRVLNLPELQDSMTVRWPLTAVKSAVLSHCQLWGIEALITFDRWGVSGHVNHIDTFLGVRAALIECQDVDLSSKKEDVCQDEEGNVHVNAESLLLDGESERGNASTHPKRVLEGYSLATVGLLRKYSGVFDLFFTLLLVFLVPLITALCRWGVPMRVSDHYIFSYLQWSPARGRGRARQSSLHPRGEGRGLGYEDVLMAMNAHRSQLVWYRRIFIRISRYSYVNTLHRIYACACCDGDAGGAVDSGCHSDCDCDCVTKCRSRFKDNR